ncbi:MAG: RimK family alpha-L-glutamate ligase [Candidatus Coproplasma sp.]
MIGWLIYGNEGLNRNKWFAERLIEAASERGVELLLKKYAVNAAYCGVNGLPDFVIVREIRPEIQKFFEERNVRVFNNFRTAKIANDKYETYLMARRLNLPVMHTVTAERADFFPCVLKTRAGHGGSEVFWINDRAELERAPVGLEDCIAQQPCSDLGKDMRVYSFGGKITAGILRTSDSDFRSNYSLGGCVERAEVSREQEEIVQAIYSELGYDFVGVDFIVNNGRWVLNEIEDVVGTRMLYKCTEIDAAEEYIEYIVNSLKNKSIGY